ncbi:uncharacterized protein LOC105841784 [Bombyx mori]
MVYLVKAEKSIMNYTAWLCGGCIVHPKFILTAASCLTDVSYVYAIAGYRKYVKTEDLDNDECTKRFRKRVLSYCIQKDYMIKMPELHWWNWKDLALARVETPYNFHDDSYLKYCSYKPNLIKINYNPEFLTPGTDVVALGWGTTKYYRPEGDYTDYNEEYLRYTSTVLIDASICRVNYEDLPYRMADYTRTMWLCTEKAGNLDVEGKIIRASTPVESCRRTYGNNRACDHIEKSGLRRSFHIGNKTYYEFTRRNGICQNDHGGPLITWIGGQPHVIGVATTFLVNEKMECVGPFVFTSTYCNSQFLHCSLTADQGTRRSGSCNGTTEITDNEFQWKNKSQKKD